MITFSDWTIASCGPPTHLHRISGTVYPNATRPTGLTGLAGCMGPKSRI